MTAKNVLFQMPHHIVGHDMSQKALFITGASSSIGAATARLAVAHGWQVGMFARSEDKLDALSIELGDKVVALPGDVTDLDDIKTAMATFVSKTGGLNAVFANAGMRLSTSGGAEEAHSFCKAQECACSCLLQSACRPTALPICCICNAARPQAAVRPLL